MTVHTVTISKPKSNEYDEYYHQYVSLFDPDDFLTAFRNQPAELSQLLSGIGDEANKCHDPYTWTLKQLMGHLIDCERIFSTRVLRIGVADKTPIPGINQNIYVENLDYESVSMEHLLEEFRLLREANFMLASRMRVENLDQSCEASGNQVTARANLYILGGHVVYHFKIMKRRLGVG